MLDILLVTLVVYVTMVPVFAVFLAKFNDGAPSDKMIAASAIFWPIGLPVAIIILLFSLVVKLVRHTRED